jgi:hypothetical protein
MSTAGTFFRRFPHDEDPQDLLDPENQLSTPWGTADHGPCDKCNGECVIKYECLSCIAEGADSSCPACSGRVTFEARCPTCEGDGMIDRTRRRGVSAFPTEAGLYLYLAEERADLSDDRLLVMEGELTGDLDLDAERGAVLIAPTAILGSRDFDPSRLARARS